MCKPVAIFTSLSNTSPVTELLAARCLTVVVVAPELLAIESEVSMNGVAVRGRQAPLVAEASDGIYGGVFGDLFYPWMAILTTEMLHPQRQTN